MPNSGSTTERGYGAHHQALRREWAPTVANGDAYCAALTCLDPDGTGRWIAPGTNWDLGHTEDRSDYTGPEHRACNRSEGAVRRNQKPRDDHPAAVRPLPTSESWWG